MATERHKNCAVIRAVFALRLAMLASPMRRHVWPGFFRPILFFGSTIYLGRTAAWPGMWPGIFTAELLHRRIPATFPATRDDARHLVADAT